MSTPLGSRVRDLLDRAVAAGILTAEQAAAVTALDSTPDGAGAAPTHAAATAARSSTRGHGPSTSHSSAPRNSAAPTARVPPT